MVEHSSQKTRDCYRPGINPKIKGCISNKEAEEYIKGTVKGTVKVDGPMSTRKLGYAKLNNKEHGMALIASEYNGELSDFDPDDRY